ncbi:MAG: hypothetical protein M1839_006349 [Geoglossum umbratile]|nr:MAG: hypothetical protein M1839_006349 [Geoglossum umbratile]
MAHRPTDLDALVPELYAMDQSRTGALGELPQGELTRKVFEQEELDHELARLRPLTQFMWACHRHVVKRVTSKEVKKLLLEGETINELEIVNRPLCGLEALRVQQDILLRLLELYPWAIPLKTAARATLERTGKFPATDAVSGRSELELALEPVLFVPVQPLVDFLDTTELTQEIFGSDIAFAFQDPDDMRPSRIGHATEVGLNPTTPGGPAPGDRHRGHPDSLRSCFDELKFSRCGLKGLVIFKYNPPHKLTRDELSRGLRDLDFCSVLAHNANVTDDEQRFRREAGLTLALGAAEAELTLASCVIQTSDYMVCAGMTLGAIFIGENLVFLHQRSRDPRIVYLHLAEPLSNAAVQAAAFPDDSAINLSTASRLLAYVLRYLAFERARTHIDRRSGESLSTRDGDYCRHIGPRPNQRSAEWRRSRGERTANGEGAQRTGTTQGRNSPGVGSSSSGRRKREYCTQTCLVGLTRGLPLDPYCPNLTQHQTHGPGMTSHPISKDSFVRLLCEQLDQSLDVDCTPLGKHGSIGYIFQLTLTAYGYTIIGKGTKIEDAPTIRYEQSIYDHLFSIQGMHIPVCLGTLDLVWPYAYDIAIKISHFLLLSFVNEYSLYEHNYGQYWDTKPLRRIHEAGVMHNDVRSPNILSSAETGSLMLIDFEQAEIVVPAEKRPRSQDNSRAETIAAEASAARIISDNMDAEVEVMGSILRIPAERIRSQGRLLKYS